MSAAAHDKNLVVQVIYLEAVLAMLPPWMRMKAHTLVEVAGLAGKKIDVSHPQPSTAYCFSGKILFLCLTQSCKLRWTMQCRFGGQQQQRPRTVEVPLKLTLKELYTGTTKKLKITRRVFNKATNKLEEKEVWRNLCLKSFW